MKPLTDVEERHRNWLQSITNKRKEEEEQILKLALKAEKRRKKFKEALLAKALKARAVSQEQEEIEAIDEQIKQESDAGNGGPTMPPEAQAQQQAMEQQYPPEDNTGAANESMTPMLDAEVEKYSALLNRR